MSTDSVRKDLAIVIVNYNTRDDLDSCLQSIKESVGDFSYDVIVVDNASDDESAAMVRKNHPWVTKLIRNKDNEGYASANNIGLRSLGFGEEEHNNQLTPRYALLLNPDTVLPPNALSSMLVYMDEHPDVGVAGPKLVRQDGSLDKACRRSFPTPRVSFYHMMRLDEFFPNSERFGRYNLTYLDADVDSEVDAVVGAFMLIRSKALHQTGLLDESFFMYGEDLDLCYRIKEAGWRIMYHPGVTVLHIKGAASRKNSEQATLAFYQAMRIFHEKHYRQETPWLVNKAIDLAICLLKSKAMLLNRLRPPERKRVASA